MKKISLVIPVFNENENVDIIYNEIIKIFSLQLNNYLLEIVFVDNSSKDDTYDRVKKISGLDSRVKGIKLSRNFGYQASILTGYLNTSGDAVVQMDADGEDPPSVVSEFVKKWEEGYDVIFGVRVTRSESVFMQWQRQIFYKTLNRIASVHLPPSAGDFRLLSRAVVEILCEKYTERNPYLRGLISSIGFKQTGVPYHRGKRVKGPSKFSYSDYMKLSWDAVTSFSRVPLTLVTIFGLLISFSSLIGILVYLILYLFGRIEAKGFTTIVLLLLLSSGVQMMCIGVLGEYIGRIFDEVKYRPRSIVNSSCGFKGKPQNA